MCGRFSQSMSRDDYLAFLADEHAISSIPHDPEPIGRYNVAPGTRVLLLSKQEDELHLDPVHWGYAPSWWNKPALINARGETAATKPMFKHLWEHAARSASPTVGLKGRGKGIRNSPISSIVRMATRFSLPALVAHHMTAAMRMRGLSSSLRQLARGWWIFMTEGLSC